MTWLPIRVGSEGERKAIFALQPEVWSTFREVLQLACAATDSSLLALCDARLAQLMNCGAVLAAIDPDLLAQLSTWEVSDRFSDRERAALAYTEQFHYDQNRLTVDQKKQMENSFSLPELVNFVTSLQVRDAYQRMLTLLDVDPDPDVVAVLENDDRVSAARKAELADHQLTQIGSQRQMALRSAMNPALRGARGTFARAAFRNDAVDPITDEMCRLRNANHQGCKY